MSIPSVSVNRHDRYTPELRDRIAEALRAPLSATAYHVLTQPLLRELADTVSESAAILSVYLQLAPDRRIGGAWRTYLSSMSDAMLKPIEDRRPRQTLQDEFARIEQAMDEELPGLGRGAAFFVCRAIGLWRQVSVPLPLPDGVHRGARPYTRPLVRTRDEHGSFVIALLSEELSRYFISQIGQVQEVFNIHGANVRRMAIEHRPKDSHDGSFAKALGVEARILAKAAELVLTRYEGRYLLLAEAKDLRAAVVHELGKETQQRLGAEFAVEIHARATDIAAAAERAQRAIEEREEVVTVQRLLDAGPERSAWGVDATLRALWESRVATVVVDDMFATPGARCHACRALLQTPQGPCPVCGSDAIDTAEDVVELAIEQTLAEDGAFEMVYSAAARQMLERIGPTAALLRW